MSNITIREAGMEEMPRIAAMKKQIHDVHVAGRPDLFQPMVEASAFEEHVENRGLRLLLAEMEGEAVGYALIHRLERAANPYMKERSCLHVEEFCVDESHRRCGIGQALMKAVREIAKAENLPRIELDTWAFNEGAKQFYEAAGFSTFRYFMEMKTED